MTDYIDTGLKILGFVAAVGGGAGSLAWWLGSRLDGITSHISRLELRMAQRLTRLETHIFNGHYRHTVVVSDESIDD